LGGKSDLGSGCFAFETIFGWTLRGPVDDNCAKQSVSNVITNNVAIDSLNKKLKADKGHKEVVDKFTSKVRFEDGRYHAPLPFTSIDGHLQIRMSLSVD
jgi:hypothetical protein